MVSVFVPFVCASGRVGVALLWIWLLGGRVVLPLCWGVSCVYGCVCIGMVWHATILLSITLFEVAALHLLLLMKPQAWILLPHHYCLRILPIDGDALNEKRTPHTRTRSSRTHVFGCDDPRSRLRYSLLIPEFVLEIILDLELA